MSTYDYTQLYQLLRKQSWQEADIETRKLMLKIAGAEGRKEILLTQSDIEQFPCKELHYIDRLWLKTSSGKFGFSVINKVYRSLNCDYSHLASYVGWKEGENWLNYHQINFANDAPVGHLPVTWLVPTTFSMYWSSRFASAGWRLLLSRFEECRLSGRAQK